MQRYPQSGVLTRNFEKFFQISLSRLIVEVTPHGGSVMSDQDAEDPQSDEDDHVKRVAEREKKE
jgi:hypothetical protein